MTRWRYRPYQALAVVLLAALVTACAVFAPLYDRAMQQSLTRVTLDDAPVLARSLLLTNTPDNPYDGVLPADAVAARLPAAYRSDFHPPILGYSASSTVVPGGRNDPIGTLVWRDGECDHLTLTRGRCPQAAGEVVVSSADARNFGFTVGATPRVVGAAHLVGKKVRAYVVPLRVVGIYRQQPGDFWFGQTLTGFSGVVSDGVPSHIQHDVWLSTRDTFEGSAARVNQTSSTAGYLIDPDRARVDQVLALGPVVDRLHDAPADHGVKVDVTSGLTEIADGIQGQIDQSRVTVPLLMAQLGLLAVVVLWLVLLAVTEQRRPEAALAKLRGRGHTGARGLLLAELLPVTLAGIVPGALLALLAAWFARTSVLPGGVPFELRLPVVLGLVVALLVLVVVTVVASVRVAREPVADLLRRVPPRQGAWALGVADALVIAACGAVVVLFATGGLTGPIALAAPGLMAIVVGLVLAHLTTPTAGLLGRRLLTRGRVRAGVSVLDAARSPATRRTVAIVTLAAALAVFSADALLVGQRNRESAAEQQVGAPLVASVQGSALAQVRAALEEVDPGGRAATPVVRVVRPDSKAGETLAVLPGAFPHVALFPGGAPDPALWERLKAPDTGPITLTGTTLSLDVDDSTLSSRQVDGTPYDVTVGVDLFTADGEPLHLRLGTVADGAAHTVLQRPVDCADGCKLTGIWFGTLPGATMRGSATLGNLRLAPSDDVVPLGPTSQWTPLRDPSAGSLTPHSTDPDRLTIAVEGRGVSLLTLPQVWLPTVIPALVAGDLPVDAQGDRFPIAGLDGQEMPARQVGTLDRVPESGPTTYVAGLDTLERGSSVLSTDRIEVWFAHDDPALLAKVEAALADRDVSLAGTTTLAGTRQSFDRTAASWSLQLAALVGAMAILIALLVLVVSAVSSWRLRARDLAALRMTGVRGSSIRSMAVAAQLPAVLLGIVAGTGCGLAGAVLVMPTVPMFAVDPVVSTLDLGTAWGAVGVAVAVATVVLGAGSVLIGRALAARSDVRRLRETGL